MLRDGLVARIDRKSWTRPVIFDWLQREGNIDETEMHRVFNCGIGMVVVVAAADAAQVKAGLAAAGETVAEIGTIEAGQGPGRVELV